MRTTSQETSPDVDKGWAYAVMFCGWLSEFLICGLPYSAAVLYIILLDEFEESPVVTASAVNITFLCFYLAMPMANCVLSLIGPRLTALVGCVLSTVGLFCCSFATNLSVITGMYGVVTGIGYSFTSLPVFTMISIYFIKYRVLALLVAGLGSGMAPFVYSPLFKFLLNDYGWRGTMLIVTGINLNMLVIAVSLMSPRKAFISILKEESPSMKDKVKRSLMESFKNIAIFRSPAWVLFCFAFCIHMTGYSGFQTHISNYARVSGYSETVQTFIPSVTGVGIITGRFVSAMLVHLFKFHPVPAYMVCHMFLGISCFIVSLTNTAVSFFIGGFITGISMATMIMMYEVVIFSIGLHRFSTGLSYLTAFSAAGMAAGGPLMACIYQFDPSYRWSFRVMSILVCVGGLLCIPSWLRIQDKKIRITAPPYD